MKGNKNRLRDRRLHIAVVIIIAVAAVALFASPIQSGLTGYFIQKGPTERTLQSIIEQAGTQFKSERSDWFNGLLVTVDCDTFNQIGINTGNYIEGQCFGKANVLYTDFMVKELPSMPDDFFLFRQALFQDPLTKRIQFDPSRFGPEYWMQPEWVIPFEEQKIQFIKSYIEDPSRGVVWGVGTWDDKVISVQKPPLSDEDIKTTVYAWIEPVPTTTGYLGVGLYEVYPDTAQFSEELGEFKKRFFQDSSLAEKYIDIKITPNEVLLEPNFPYFYTGYRKMIKIDVTIKKDTPTGIYLVGMQPDRPSKEFSDANRLAMPGYYWDPYLGFARIGTPYQIFIEVNT